MFYFDPLYLIFIMPALFISLIASILLKLWTNRYLQVPNSTNLNGMDAVHIIAQSNNLKISFSHSPESLSDHYNPAEKHLVLSNEVANRPTIGSIAISTHELGHALQDKNKNFLLTTRKILVPAVNIGTNLGYIFIILGLVITFSQLAWLGIILFSLSTIFSFLTLPVEIDASNKAINLIRQNNLLSTNEISGAKKVLIAASLTYVAAAISSISNLIYFVFRVKGINDND